LISRGTASKTAFSEPGQDEDQDHDAFEHHQAHRVRERHLADQRDADDRVEPEAGGQRDREVGEQAHADGQHARDQGRHRGHLGGVRGGAAADVVPADVGPGVEDERVQHHDVGHREEGDEAAPDLAAERRAALGDLEEMVEPGGTGGGRGRSAGAGAHGSPRGRGNVNAANGVREQRRCCRAVRGTSMSARPGPVESDPH